MKAKFQLYTSNLMDRMVDGGHDGNYEQLPSRQMASQMPNNAESLRNRGSTLWPFVLAAGVGVFVCICLCLVAVFCARVVFVMVADNQDEWQMVSDELMQAMAEKDVDSAYKLLSLAAQDEMSIAETAELFEGSYYALFEGYEHLTIESWEVNFIDFPDEPTVQLTAYISYLGNYEGSFEATLVKEGTLWKIN